MLDLTAGSSFLFGEGDEVIVTISFPPDIVNIIYPVKSIKVDKNMCIHLVKTDDAYVLINNSFRMIEIDKLIDNLDRIESYVQHI